VEGTRRRGGPIGLVYPEHRVAERAQLAVDEGLLAPIGGSAVDDDLPVGAGQRALQGFPAVVRTPAIQEHLDVFVWSRATMK